MAGRSKKRRNVSRTDVLRAAARKSARRQHARRRVGGLLVLLIGLPALIAGLILGARAAWMGLFLEKDYFLIRAIEVTTDGELSRADILEYAGVQEGMNLFAVRPADMRASLQTVPVIASAQVGRRLPDALVIEVIERVAVARLGRPGAGSPLAVDATGHVLGPSSVRPSLPVILGVRDTGLRPGDIVKDPLLEAALSVLAICQQPELRTDLLVATVDVGNADQLEVGLATGERVLLSYDRLAEKLSRLKHMREAARRKNLDLCVYDMTADRNYAGRPAATSTEER